MKNKRIFASLLAALMLSSALAGCSDSSGSGGGAESKTPSGESSKPSENSSETETETEAETEPAQIKPDIPETADYGDDDISFLVWDREGWAGTVRRYRDIIAEDGINGEGINDAVYNRNSRIESAYKVKITLERTPDSGFVAKINTSIGAGEAIYDVIYPRLVEAVTLFKSGKVHNLHNVKYIDFEKPWWDSNSVDTLTINGFLPCAATSMNVNDKDATAAIAFNKELAQSHNLEDLYTVVREGRWTIDKAAEFSDVADADTDGNGTMEPDKDIYGFLGGKDVMESFYYGAGGMMAKKNDSGELEFVFGTERDLDISAKVIEFMNQPWFMNHHMIKNTDDNYYRQLFVEGHGLFFWMRLDDVTNMREGETDFGILPIPKYEETQSDYYSMVSRWITGLPSIPITLTGEKLDEVGLILEALSADSHYTLIPEYIETSLKTKNSRDAESGEMLEVILANRVYDPMHIYNFGNFSGNYIELGNKGDPNIASFLKGNQKLVAKTMSKDLESFTQYAAN